MRALVFDGSLHLRTDYPDPVPAPGESIVRVRRAGICGTDLEITRGYMDYRGVPGHEFVGEVVHSEMSSLLGRRVVGEINAGCGRCNECKRDLARHCPRRTVLGILGRDGAFAEYLRLPDANLIPLPDSIGDDAAVFVEPIAAAYEIVEQLPSVLTSEVLIIGDGRLAAVVAMVLSMEGSSRLEIAGHHRAKLERIIDLTPEGSGRIIVAQNIGALSAHEVVIDCTGSPGGFAQALELVKPRGTIVLKSTAAAGAAMNLAPLVIKEITVLGSRCGRFRPAIDALAQKKFDPTALIDGDFSLAEGVAAFVAAADKSKFKILIRPS